MPSRWPSRSLGPGRAKPNRPGRDETAGPACRQAPAELRRSVTKVNVIFSAPVFMINTFSDVRVLSQTLLVVLDPTIAAAIATIVLLLVV